MVVDGRGIEEKGGEEVGPEDLEYDGSRSHGLQRLNSLNSVDSGNTSTTSYEPFTIEEIELRQRWSKWYGAEELAQYDAPIKFDTTTNEIFEDAI